jgi:hypothetical protein
MFDFYEKYTFFVLSKVVLIRSLKTFNVTFFNCMKGF